MAWQMTPQDEALGQVDIWSDVPTRMRLQVRLTFGQASGEADIWSDIPPG